MKNPSLWVPYFLHTTTPLTSGSFYTYNHSTVTSLCVQIDVFKGLLDIKFSEMGSNYVDGEQRAYVHFYDLLDECEGYRLPCILK